MDKSSLLKNFQSDWKQKIGPTSEFEAKLTPETRVYKRILEDVPSSVMATIIDGISIKTTENRTPIPCNKTTALLNYLPVIYAVIVILVTGCICAIANCSSVTTTIAAAIMVIATLTFAVKHSSSKNKKYEPAYKIVVHADWCIEKSALEKTLNIYLKGLEEVIAYVRKKEADLALGYDVTDSKEFGEWIQKFIDYSNRHTENNDLDILKEELISKLSLMGIEVYDSLKKNAQTGEPLLPERSCYRDGRTDDNIEFSEVVHSAVKSRRGVLAIGKIR